MKKYISLILSIFALIINFISFWHSDALINRFFVFGIIPFAFAIGTLLASFIVSLFVLITSIIRHRCALVNYISLALAIITVVMIFCFPFRMARVYLELVLYEKDRYEIVEMVKDGEILPDKLGNARLPRAYDQVSSDGNIFIYQNDEEQVVSFWVFRGMLSGSIELIYSSADRSLIYANETAHAITKIEELKEHWYLVHTDY